MMTLSFDTLAYAEKLIAAGVGEDQAKAQANALRDALTEDVATKHDIERLSDQIERLDERLSGQIEATRKELLNHFDRLQQRQDTRDQRIEATGYKIAFGVVGAVLVGVGLIVKLLV